MTKEKLSAIEKRQKQQKELFIEQLRKTPIIQLCCEKTSVARATYYRWYNEDPEFAKNVAESLSEGTELVNDMAESGLIAAIRDRNMPGIQFWLKTHKREYSTKLEINGKLQTEQVLNEEQKALLIKALELSNLLNPKDINKLTN